MTSGLIKSPLSRFLAGLLFKRKSSDLCSYLRQYLGGENLLATRSRSTAFMLFGCFRRSH